MFFTVTTRKLRSKQVININWKRLVAFFVIMVIFRCLTEYGLRTKNCQKFSSLLAKLDSFKRHQPSERTKYCIFPFFSLHCFRITLQFEINYIVIVLCLLLIIYRGLKLLLKITAHRHETLTDYLPENFVR